MKECQEFEKKYGSVAFIKVCGATLNKLLVDKGIITEEELQKYFLKEVKELKKEER